MVRPGAAQSRLVTSRGGAKRVRDVRAAVVGEHPFDADAAAREPADHALQKARRRAAALVGQHLDVGDATVVVDGHVGVLVARARDDLAAIAMNPMPDSENTRQRLDVEMDELPWTGSLVANDRDWRGESCEGD